MHNIIDNTIRLELTAIDILQRWRLIFHFYMMKINIKLILSKAIIDFNAQLRCSYLSQWSQNNILPRVFITKV